VRVLGRTAIDHVEEARLDLLGDRTALAFADLAVVDSRIGMTSAAVPVKKASSAR